MPASDDNEDPNGGGYRWIINPEVFNKYNFSWRKIQPHLQNFQIAYVRWSE